MNMTRDHFTYKNNPRWNVLIENGKLLITKGADEIYLIDELDENEANALYAAYQINNLNNSDVQDNEKIRNAILKLEKAGVIYKSTEEIEKLKENLSFSLRWIGAEHSKISNLLEEFCKNSKQLSLTKAEKSSMFSVVIRGSGKLTEVMKNYSEIEHPHLFVDIAYDHTISLGPLVFPKETACLGCFVGRLTRNWGDAEPPQISNMSDSAEFIAALVFEQVKVFQNLGSCPELIEKAWTFNSRDLTTKVDNVFRLPWCPICYPNKPKEGTGSFELPWSLKDNQL